MSTSATEKIQGKVFAAAESLHAGGVAPTMEKVREKIGGGSYSTIGPLLKQWKLEKAQAENPLGDLEMSLGTVIDLKKIHEIALKRARRELEQERAAIQRVADEAQEELAVALERNNDLAGSNDHLREQCAYLEKDRGVLQAQNEMLTALSESLRGEIQILREQLHNTRNQEVESRVALAACTEKLAGKTDLVDELNRHLVSMQEDRAQLIERIRHLEEKQPKGES